MSENTAKEHPIYQIAAEISNNNEAILKEISECVSDTKEYFKKYENRYDDRGMSDYDACEKEEVQWIGMVDILLDNGYVCECDWKEELENFLYCMKELKGIADNNLPLEESWFNENAGGINEWCETIDNKWVSYEMCVGCIDIESDCFVVFPCKIDGLEKLQKYAKKTEYKIDYARNS